MKSAPSPFSPKHRKNKKVSVVTGFAALVIVLAVGVGFYLSKGAGPSRILDALLYTVPFLLCASVVFGVIAIGFRGEAKKLLKQCSRDSDIILADAGHLLGTLAIAIVTIGVLAFMAFGIWFLSTMFLSPIE